MNEERYILARLIRELIKIEEETKREKSYRDSFHSEDIALIIAKIRADAVLGEEYDAAELPFQDEEEVD